MRKKIILLLAVLTCVCVSCGKKEDEDIIDDIMTTEQEEDTSNTCEDDGIEGTSGYPNGTVQGEYLFYNGNLYKYTRIIEGLTKDNIDERTSGYILVGKIIVVSDTDIPTVEFHASHLEVGYEIYSNPDKEQSIFVDCIEHFIEMIIVTE